MNQPNLKNQGEAMKKLFVCLALVLISMSASATDYGRWLCACKLGTIGASADSGLSQAVELSTTAPITQGFLTGDTITVCDGGVCGDYEFTPGAWLALGNLVIDSHAPYKNGSAAIQILSQGSTDGATAYNAVMTGHNEWWDYYSDGTYIGSSDPVFIVDSIDVGYTGGGYCASEVCNVTHEER
jgi:hypothetical protein